MGSVVDVDVLSASRWSVVGRIASWHYRNLSNADDGAASAAGAAGAAGAAADQPALNGLEACNAEVAPVAVGGSKAPGGCGGDCECSAGAPLALAAAQPGACSGDCACASAPAAPAAPCGDECSCSSAAAAPAPLKSPGATAHSLPAASAPIPAQSLHRLPSERRQSPFAQARDAAAAAAAAAASHTALTSEALSAAASGAALAPTPCASLPSGIELSFRSSGTDGTRLSGSAYNGSSAVPSSGIASSAVSSVTAGGGAGPSAPVPGQLRKLPLSQLGGAASAPQSLARGGSGVSRFLLAAGRTGRSSSSGSGSVRQARVNAGKGAVKLGLCCD